MTTRIVVRISIVTVLTDLTLPGPALAHAFGARFDLPLPLWLYLSGAGAAVTLTFIVLALFAFTGVGEGSGRLSLPLVLRLVCSRPVRLTWSRSPHGPRYVSI